MRMDTGKIADLHCHVLPGMDDGCQSTEESLALLKMSSKQGVYGIIATPHFYWEESAEEFVIRRQKSFETLKRAVLETGEDVPLLCMGAEAAYRRGITKLSRIKRLCLGGSGYLLIEMPFREWHMSEVLEIADFQRIGITPVIAHMERYYDKQSAGVLKQLCRTDCLIQVNADSLQNRRIRKIFLKGRMDLVSSDAHNVSSRPPRFDRVSIPPEIINNAAAVFDEAWETAPDAQKF